MDKPELFDHFYLEMTAKKYGNIRTKFPMTVEQFKTELNKSSFSSECIDTMYDTDIEDVISIDKIAGEDVCADGVV